MFKFSLIMLFIKCYENKTREQIMRTIESRRNNCKFEIVEFNLLNLIKIINKIKLLLHFRCSKLLRCGYTRHNIL